jgi:hypothetical protein
MAEPDTGQFDLDDATRFVLSDARARRFVWWILEQCGVFRVSFSGNSSTFFAEGERNIGLKIISQLDGVSPTAFPKLMFDMASEAEARKSVGKDEPNHVSEAE